MNDSPAGTAEDPPALSEALTDADRASVEFGITATGGLIDFTLTDTTKWPDGRCDRALRVDARGNTCLVVEPGQDRIFTFSLSRDWRWAFDFKATRTGDCVTIKHGDAGLYRVVPVDAQTIEIHARARPKSPPEGASDYLNLYVVMDQAKGDPVAVRIDPITNNPPPNGG